MNINLENQNNSTNEDLQTLIDGNSVKEISEIQEGDPNTIKAKQGDGIMKLIRRAHDNTSMDYSKEKIEAFRRLNNMGPNEELEVGKLYKRKEDNQESNEELTERITPSIFLENLKKEYAKIKSKKPSFKVVLMHIEQELSMTKKGSRKQPKFPHIQNRSKESIYLRAKYNNPFNIHYKGEENQKFFTDTTQTGNRIHTQKYNKYPSLQKGFNDYLHRIMVERDPAAKKMGLGTLAEQENGLLYFHKMESTCYQEGNLLNGEIDVYLTRQLNQPHNDPESFTILSSSENEDDIFYEINKIYRLIKLTKKNNNYDLSQGRNKFTVEKSKKLENNIYITNIIFTKTGTHSLGDTKVTDTTKYETQIQQAQDNYDKAYNYTKKIVPENEQNREVQEKLIKSLSDFFIKGLKSGKFKYKHSTFYLDGDFVKIRGTEIKIKNKNQTLLQDDINQINNNILLEQKRILEKKYPNIKLKVITGKSVWSMLNNNGISPEKLTSNYISNQMFFQYINGIKDHTKLQKNAKYLVWEVSKKREIKKSQEYTTKIDKNFLKNLSKTIIGLTKIKKIKIDPAHKRTPFIEKKGSLYIYTKDGEKKLDMKASGLPEQHFKQINSIDRSQKGLLDELNTIYFQEKKIATVNLLIKNIKKGAKIEKKDGNYPFYLEGGAIKASIDQTIDREYLDDINNCTKNDVIWMNNMLLKKLKKITQTESKKYYDANEIDKVPFDFADWKENIEVLSHEFSGYVFIIDPGHGGMDPGAVPNTKTGTGDEIMVLEAPNVYDVSLRLIKYLVENGATVDITHYFTHRGISNEKDLPKVKEIRGKTAYFMDVYNDSSGKHLFKKEGSINRRLKIINNFAKKHKEKDAYNKKTKNIFSLSLHADNDGPKRLPIVTYYNIKGKGKDLVSKKFAEELVNNKIGNLEWKGSKDNGEYFYEDAIAKGHMKYDNGLGILKSKHTDADVLIELVNMGDTKTLTSWRLREGSNRQVYAEQIGQSLLNVCKYYNTNPAERPGK